MIDHAILSRELYQTALRVLLGVYDGDGVVADALLKEAKAIAEDGLEPDSDAAVERLQGVLARFGLDNKPSRVQ